MCVWGAGGGGTLYNLPHGWDCGVGGGQRLQITGAILNTLLQLIITIFKILYSFENRVEPDQLASEERL